MAALLLVLLTVAAYAPALSAGFVWDDFDYVVHNPHLRSPEGLSRIWTEPGATRQYYPLVFTSFWLERRLWGEQPMGYHLVNILLHAANALLVWAILTRLGVPGAVLAAALFALHPVHAESVAWISERKNTLSALFYLLSALAWFRYSPPEADGPARNRWPWAAAAFGLFLLALWSKTVTASLPAALVLVLAWRRGRVPWRDALHLAPLAALGAILAAHTGIMERYWVGARGTEWVFSLAERVLIAGRAVWFYAGKLAWPEPLMFIYPRWHLDAADWRQYLPPALAATVILALWLRRKRLGPGPVTGVLFFVGTLAPALGFVSYYPMLFSFVADHFQYLASLGLLTLAATVLARGVTAARPAMRWTTACGTAVVLLALGAATWQRAGVFHDAVTLHEDTLRKNPDCWMALGNLGGIQASRENFAEAVRLLERATFLYPAASGQWYELGRARMGCGDAAGAIEAFGQAVTREPGYTMAWRERGMVWVRLGQYDRAAADLSMVVRLNPEYRDAWFFRSVCRLRTGDIPGAREDLNRYVALGGRPDPRFVDELARAPDGGNRPAETAASGRR